MKRAALIFLLLVSCRRAPSPPTPREESKPPSGVELSEAAIVNGQVEWRKIEPGAFTPRLRVVANIVSDAQHLAQIGARVAGRVTSIPVTLGQRVRRGQTLLEVDTVELHQVTLEYLTATARARAAADALARQQQLFAERVGAQADLRKAETDRDSAEAALKESDEHLHFLGLGDKAIAALASESTHGSARSAVPSPIDGRVVAMRLSLGQVLTGSEDVITVADVDNVWVSLRLYERDLANVVVGTPVEVRLTAFPEKSFTTRVSFVSDVLDPQSRTGEARAPLPNPDALLRPGMSGSAFVPIAASKAGERMLPAEAVQLHDGGTIVFVHTSGRRFEPRVVRVGEELGGVVPLIDGAGPNDEIVVHGAFAVRGELERAALEE